MFIFQKNKRKDNYDSHHISFWILHKWVFYKMYYFLILGIFTLIKLLSDFSKFCTILWISGTRFYYYFLQWSILFDFIHALEMTLTITVNLSVYLRLVFSEQSCWTHPLFLLFISRTEMLLNVTAPLFPLLTPCLQIQCDTHRAATQDQNWLHTSH